MNSTFRLMQIYAERSGMAVSTLGRLTVGSSTVSVRLASGKVTINTVRRVEQWLSDHWSADLPWPPDIPRPALSPDRDAA